MASQTLKCASCNLVINEVLAFIVNKLDVMNEQSISQICVSAFDETEILAAKNLLFDSISTTKREKIRKRQGKTLRDIDDIISVLKETDPEIIPTFVARDLHKMPPVLFDHVDVTRLLKDLLTMKCEMQRICDEYATVKQVKQLQQEIESLKNISIVNNFGRNVTVKRGGGCARLSSFEYESGPSALFTNLGVQTEGSIEEPFHMSNGSIAAADHTVIDSAQTSPPLPAPQPQLPVPASPLPPPPPQQPAPVPVVDHTTQTPSRPSVTPPKTTTSAAPIHTIRKNDVQYESGRKSYSNVAQEGEWKTQDRRKRSQNQNRFVGKPGKATVSADSKFKAAETKVPIYIYNVAKDATVCAITTYVKSKTNIDVRVEKMSMKLMKDYDAYKVFVPKHKKDIFLKDDFWPDGVIYRPFVDFNNRKSKNTFYRDMVY
ncbi:hypothetical protein O0L34_g17812 [Tuta absoluta]|nr:hypothetical protein O0L34_g17812 [Tuta absoluta]